MARVQEHQIRILRIASRPHSGTPASGNLKHDLPGLVRRASQHFMCPPDIPQRRHGSDSRIQLHTIDHVGDGVQPWRRHVYLEKDRMDI